MGGKSRATDRVRLADVAEAAGVAISTVSRVFSHPERVNFQTVEHVRAIAERLGYRPRPARAEAEPSSERDDEREGLFALVVKDTSDGISSQILKGAQLTAMESGHVVSVIETGRSAVWAESMLGHLRRNVDGLILATDQLSVAGIRKLSRSMPVVALNRPVEGVPSVVPDPMLGVCRALGMLRRYGHRSVAYVSGPVSWANQSRWGCLHRMAAHYGLTVRQIGSVSPTVEGGYQAALALEGAMPDAVVAYNDLVAAGMVLRLTADGVKVPGDVSVLGFDNTLIAPVVSPPITTIRIPRAVMGQAAVNLLLGQPVSRMLSPREAELRQYLTDHGVHSEDLGSDVVQIDTSLIVRRSVGTAHAPAPSLLQSCVQSPIQQR